MIRGVNKNMIEINDTKNEYIEKAILIINPKKANTSAAVLTDQATEYLCGVILPPKEPHKTTQLAAAIAKFLLSGMVGGILTAIALQLW